MPPASLQAEDVVRVPLVGTFTKRNDSGTSFGSSGIVGLGTVGLMVVGGATGSAATKDQRFINCIPEKVTNPYTGAAKFYVSKRPGFARYATLKSGHVGNAIKVWSAKGSGTSIVSALGNTNSEVFENTTSLGSITGKVVEISETLISTTPYLAFASDNNTAWYYPDGGAVTQITDADFPGNAGRTITGGFVFMDGYAFIMDTTGRVYNSDLNSIAAWSSDNYAVAQMYPDAGIGLLRYKNQLVAFGRETTEFFYNAGNETGSPLARTPQAFIRLGCAGPKALTQFEDTVAWVSSSDKNGVGVYVLDGYAPKRISTPTVDTQLQLSNLSDVYVTAIRMVGKSFVVVTTTSTTFVYCLEDDSWHEWASTYPLWHKLTGTTGSNSLVYGISASSTNGRVYVVNSSGFQYQDDGVDYTMTLQTTKFDGDTTARKFLNKLTLVGDQTPSTATMYVSWSDDDYNTFNTARTIDMSGSAQYLSNCGQFRRRAFKLVNSDSTFVRLEALEMQLKKGMH